MRESTLQRSVMRWLKQKKIWHLKIHGSPFTKRGIPDLLILVPQVGHSIPLFVELKRPGERPTKLQEKRIEELIFAGAECRVVTSLEQLQEIMASLMRG